MTAVAEAPLLERVGRMLGVATPVGVMVGLALAAGGVRPPVELGSLGGVGSPWQENDTEREPYCAEFARHWSSSNGSEFSQTSQPKGSVGDEQEVSQVPPLFNSLQVTRYPFWQTPFCAKMRVPPPLA